MHLHRRIQDNSAPYRQGQVVTVKKISKCIIHSINYIYAYKNINIKLHHLFTCCFESMRITYTPSLYLTSRILFTLYVSRYMYF